MFLDLDGTARPGSQESPVETRRARAIASTPPSLRRGPVVGLRWTDVDVVKRELQVLQQLATERSRLVLKQLKTQQTEFNVTFGPVTAPVIEAHREKQRAEAEFAGGAWKDQRIVFTTALGGCVDPNNFGGLMDRSSDEPACSESLQKAPALRAKSIGRAVVGVDKVMQERLGHQTSASPSAPTPTWSMSSIARRARPLDEVLRGRTDYFRGRSRLGAGSTQQPAEVER